MTIFWARVWEIPNPRPTRQKNLYQIVCTGYCGMRPSHVTSTSSSSKQIAHHIYSAKSSSGSSKSDEMNFILSLSEPNSGTFLDLCLICSMRTGIPVSGHFQRASSPHVTSTLHVTFMPNLPTLRFHTRRNLILPCIPSSYVVSCSHATKNSYFRPAATPRGRRVRHKGGK